MNYWKISTFALLALIVAVLAGPADAGEKSPHMRGALVNLKAAKSQLEKAEGGGGHREKALGLVTQAIAEVEQGVE
jgi:hypothetical protein